MDNCLKTPTSQFRKLLASLFVFAGLCAGAWAADAVEYYWIGGGADNDWTTVENWSTTEGDTPGTGTACPGADDIAHIYGNVEVIISSHISVSKLLIQAGSSHYLDSSFTTTLTGSDSSAKLSVTDITATAINITRCSSTNGVIGTLALNLPVTCAGEIQTHSGTTLEINDKLTTENLVHSAYGDTPKTLLKVNGTLTVNDTLNLNAMSGGATQLNVQSGKTVNANKIIFGADDYNNKDVTSAIVNAGTIRVTEEFTIRNIDVTPYTGSGKIQLDGNGAAFTNNYTGGAITIAELECKQTSVIAGSTNFTNITATGLGGKTLTINGSQTITGDFDLSGSSINKLTVTGSGSLSLSNPLIAEYLDFTGTGPSISDGNAYASNSSGSPDGWTVTSGNLHVWNGGNGNWEVTSNWIPQTVPANTDEIFINSGRPEINSDVTAKSITITGTAGVNVKANKSLTLSDGCELDGKISGDGKLILSAGQNYTVHSTTSLDINVENNGSLSATGPVIFAKSLNNAGSASFTSGAEIAGDLEDSGTFNGAITFNGTTDQSFNPNNVIYSNITVNKSSGTLTVADSLQVTNLSLTAGPVSLTGDLFLWDGSDYQDYDFSSIGGTLTFTGGSFSNPRILRAGAITNSSEISADYLKLEAQGSTNITLNSCANISNLTLETSGSITVNGIEADSLSIPAGAASIKMGDTITINSTITLGADTQFYKNTILAGTAALTGDNTYSVNNNFTNSGNWTWPSASTIIFDGAADQIFTTNSSTSYPPIIVNKTSGTFTIVNALTAASYTCSSGTEASIGADISTSGNQNFGGKVTLTGNAELSAAGSSTITLNDDIDGSGNTLTLSGSASLSGGKTINPDLIISAGSGSLSCSGEAIFKGTVTNNGTLTCAGTTTFNGAYSGSGDLTLANADTTFANDLDLSDCGTFTPSTGRVILTAAKKSPANLTGPQNFNNLKITGSVNIAGNNTIENLDASNLDGKTITFDSGSNQTITDMTLSGNSNTSKLTLTSTGAWSISCTNEPTLQYLSVKNSTNSSSPAKDFIASDSTDEGGNVNWNFPGMSYEWIAAATDSDWTNASNWSPASIPGFGSKITINAASNYPKLSVTGSPSPLDLSGGTYTAEITVEAGASFDLADKSLILGTSTASGSITNKGTVILNGISTQAITNAQMINSGDASTVKYSAPSPAGDTVNFVWDGDSSTSDKKEYTNLIIENTVDAATENIIVSKALSISKDISSLNSISVGTTTTINSGCTAITTTGNQIYTDEVSISESNGTKLETTGGEISLATVSGTGLTVTGNLKVAAGTTTTINTSGNQIYNCAIYGGGNLSLDSTANAGSGIITFKNDIDGSTLLSSLTTRGAVTIDCDNIKTSGAQNYDSNITISKATGAALTGNDITFKNNVSGSSLTVNGNLKISGNVAINNTTQTYNGTINGTTADTDTLTLTSTGLITFNENVGSATPLLKELTTTTGSNAKINCTSITTSGTQIYNGTFDLGDSGTYALLTLDASKIVFHADVSDSTPASSLKIKKPLEIYCNNITTSGTQTYDNTVKFYNSTALTSDNTVTFNANVSNDDSAATAILTINADTEIGTDLTIKANEFYFSGNLTGEGKTLTLEVPSLKSIADPDSTKEIKLSNLTINQDTTISTQNNTFIDYNVAATGSAGNKLIIDSSVKNLEFKQTATINTAFETNANSKLTAFAGLTTFTGDLTIAGEFVANGGTIKFAGNTQSLTVDSATTFNNVLISSPAKVTSSSSFKVNGTSWDNTTTADGFVASAGSTITFNNATATEDSPVSVKGINKFHDVVCNTAGQNITFENGNIFSNTVTIGNSSTPVMAGTVKISSSAEITFNPNLNCNKLTINAGDKDVTFNGNASYGDSFTNSGSGNSIFKASFTGSGDASFAGDIYLTDNTTNRNFSAGSGKKIETSTNIIVDTDASNLININTHNDSLVKAKNFVLYSGKIELQGSLESTGDIILLGGTYITVDSETGIDGVYLYKQNRNSAYQFTQDFRTGPFAGQITECGGATIKAGKNFYSNNISINATSDWNLQLAKTSDAEEGFAEAISTTVNKCKVRCHQDISNNATDDTAPAKVVAYNCSGSGNENWNFDEFKILNAWTERDNAIYIEFNAPVRNHHNEVNNSHTYLTYKGTSATQTSYSGIYSDADCQHAITDDVTTEVSTGTYALYLKAPDSWNTDATGKSAGQNSSSDRNGYHKSSIPYIDIPRSLTVTSGGTSTNVNYIVTNIWGKRLKNYSTRTPNTGKAYGTNEAAGQKTYVHDKTGPVLWTVRTGQELHAAYDTATGEASQHSYDSHNFLEFRYSEPVDFGTGAGSIAAYNPPADPSKNPNVVENIQVTDTLGAVTGNITSASSEITFAGLARITGTSLLLHTGSNGSANKYMNALYRQDEYSIRLSIAGWTDGTVSDYAGNIYKKWPGYIEAASQFTGATAHIVDSSNNMFTLVKDQAGNPQTQYAVNMVNPQITDNASSTDLYSQWDLSSPVFAPLRFSSRTAWGEQEMSEAIGNTNGSGSTLDRIDFHFFDNTPAYNNTDQAEWFTEIGWCKPGSDADKANLKTSFSYAADNTGGARQFESALTRRTSGGIRFSTKADIAPAFKYAASYNSTPSTSFLTGIANIHTTVVSQLFTGSSAPMRPANDPDGLYMGLGLTDTNLSFDTTFTFSYNDNTGYLTDLAGNRLHSKTSKTIDRTPPSFDVILSPIDTKSIYIVFVKEILTETKNISFRDNSGNNITINEDFTNLMPLCFRIISINSDGSISQDTDNQIDTSVPAEIIERFSNESFTCIKLTTTKEINIENLKNLYIQLIIPEPYHSTYPTGTLDPLTNNINSRVTFIQDQLGNYMSLYSAHALSDFAINYVKPLYAYASDMNDKDGPVMNNLYEEGSWAVHDWNAKQQNYGTLPANHAAAIVADTKGNSKLRIYLSPSPDADSVSHQLNADFKLKLRIWLPDLQDGIFRALAAVNNTNFVFTDGSLMQENSEDSQNSIFNLSKEMVSEWPSGSQVSFMFGLMEDEANPVRIYNNPYYDVANESFDLSLSIPVPLYCLRMTNIDDIGTLDLWSFKLRGITEQRGGVTILNNVINSGKGENTVIKVTIPEDGRLNVMVMTLDGNIITYLNRGQTKAGEHYFTWNGKNGKGKEVARGMYFVRVTGSGIDETRKVMVVKD